MCIPYIIPDPPPRKRPRKSGLIVQSSPPKSPKLQPAFIEISPRLTYVASPKPDRSPIPPRGRLSAMKPPRRAPGAEFLDGFVAGEQASRQEEGRVVKDESESAEPKPKSAPPSQKPEPPTKSTPPAMDEQKPPQQPADTPTSLAKPSPFHPPSQPPPSTTHQPHRHPIFSAPPHQQPHPPAPIRSPYSYTRRPPHPTHRTRSLSPDSTISHRSFERLKRNLNTLFERVKVLEAEKEVREADVRRRRRGWELGMGGGRREGSLIRERRREGSLIRERRERERGRGKERERWDWEGGGLGRL